MTDTKQLKNTRAFLKGVNSGMRIARANPAVALHTLFYAAYGQNWKEIDMELIQDIVAELREWEAAVHD